MDLSKYRGADFTYTEIGATAGPLPLGYHHVDARRVVGNGIASFDAVSDALLGWDMHRGAGLHVHADRASAAADAVVVLTLGPIRIPCRVVYVIDEANRQGFAYGTVTGHPESGEELFVVEYSPEDDTVTAHITAFSIPGRWYTRVGGPIGRLTQRYFTKRYLDALTDVGSRVG